MNEIARPVKAEVLAVTIPSRILRSLAYHNVDSLLPPEIINVGSGAATITAYPHDACIRNLG